MEKIRCVNGLKPEQLTADQKEKLQLFVKAAGEGLLGIECFNNLETVDEEIPIGTVFYFSPDAIVDSTLISDSMFQTFCVSKILEAPYEKELNDTHFSKNAENISNAVPQFVASELTPRETHETSPWLSELGGPNSFVGVFYQMREDHKGKDYFIVGRGTSPSIVSNLKSSIDNKAPTYGQLLKDPEWQRQIASAKYMANRNVQRNLAQVAEACNVGISRMLDFSSVVANPAFGVGERAEPEYKQKLFTIQEARFDGKPAVAFYNGVVPTDNIMAEKFFLAANPAKDGIYVFPISEKINSKGVSANTNKALTREMKHEMKISGWNPEDHIGILVPIATKIFDEKIKRK